jgi:hypothetical protein
VGSGVTVIGLSVMPSSPSVWQENAGRQQRVDLARGPIVGTSGALQPRDIDRAISLLEKALARPLDDADGWDLDLRLEELRELKSSDS